MKSLSCPNKHPPLSGKGDVGAIIPHGFYTTRLGKCGRYQCQTRGKTVENSLGMFLPRSTFLFACVWRINTATDSASHRPAKVRRVRLSKRTPPGQGSEQISRLRHIYKLNERMVSGCVAWPSSSQ